MPRRRAAAGLALLLATGCTAQPEQPEQPEQTRQPASPVTYVALGDSVAAGVGDAGGGGYVQRLVRLLAEPGACGSDCPPVELVDLSRSGATTSSVLSTQLPAAQAAFSEAAPETPRLVTLTVGGNDVVGPLAAACGEAVGATCRRAVDEAYRTVADNLGRVLDALRAAAGPDATLAVMTYYDSFAGCRLRSLSPLARQVLDGDPAAGLPGFNDLLADVARERDALVVGTDDVVGPDELVGGNDCLHPNDAGHARIADRFREVVGGRLTPAG